MMPTDEDDGSTPDTELNSGKPWTAEDEALLRELAAENTPTRVIGLKLGRTEAAVFAHSSRIGVSLKPVNQSPFRRREGT